MKKLNKTKKQQGFTLIELMIVVAVIGVLAAIAVPQYQKYVAKSEAASALASITGHRINVETYVVENGTFPTSAQLAVPTSPLGTITYTAAASGASASSGAIKFSFGSTGVSPDVLNKDVTLNRDGSGKWSCTSGITADGVRPKGCS
ncbi:TPA: prepilin-type N-terminal cleavage/methylation domain-containing protein [Vibrio vulnificus]|uniref:Prepilin-type N-terminal cleavage/methylation domain-containing protein n=1 Tax=Vibrio vulnificus TaxID=672 RepID=A0AAN1PM88_VIBVL|nr:pilin [Vibrio vulnificus]AXX58851.1 prepilin-type N-terminal cleavage/methylation domain-containing protein [Vibrio vulnificus]EGQ9883269.1 prepilin-type N-terminal cleavage/methylation domain-containing protein [Vibrio vulnificus]MCA4022088.1 pilin [Vibrio vulnificus]HAS6195912.1 prepilin-type N-terminal cleavage/methylation domain-containing protein [Vibrio vulnificus]HAS6268942.1 prepilin-type N-terminal cleavage/methylation domain-containing protein [Vibrio vulnificus]